MNLTNYDLKFKDRKPEETIEIISNFFTSKGFTITEDYCKAIPNIVNCYESLVTLNYDDITVLKAQGKGTSSIYCSAAGYAELYERFCNLEGIYTDERLIKQIQNANYEQHGYYWDSEEKEGSCDTLIPDKNFADYFKQNKIYTDFMLDNKYITVPFKSILDKDTIEYYNPILMHLMMGTTGMAAGNTLEEALTGAICELFEREAIVMLKNLRVNQDTRFSRISTDSISKPVLQELIKSIELAGTKLEIIDLSTILKLPVILVFFIEQDTLKITTSIGVHPVFNIALERCLLEHYQSNKYPINNLNEEIALQVQAAFNNAANCIHTTTEYHDLATIFNNSFYLQAVSTDIESEYYLGDLDYSQEKLLNFCKYLCRLNNLNIYYRDCSLSTEMTAVYTYCPYFVIPGHVSNQKVVASSLNLSQFDIELYTNFYDNYAFDIINNLEHSMFSYFMTDLKFIDSLCLEIAKLPPAEQIQKIPELYEELNKSQYSTELKYLITLFKYRLMNYSFDNIRQLFEQFNLKIEYSKFKDDWDNSCNYSYIYRKYITGAFKNKYTAEKLTAILQVFSS